MNVLDKLGFSQGLDFEKEPLIFIEAKAHIFASYECNRLELLDKSAADPRAAARMVAIRDSKNRATPARASEADTHHGPLGHSSGPGKSRKEFRKAKD
jgi:hypothetical protein